MIYYKSSCDIPIPDPVCDNCIEPEHGRIRSAGFMREDFAFNNISDPTEWENAINEKLIYVLPMTQGDFDGGTPKTAPGYGSVHLRLLTTDYKLKFKDPNYLANAGFWQAMQQTNNWIPFFVTETQVNIADKPCQIIAKAMVADDDMSEVVWDVECEWVSSNIPAPAPIPTGIFQCFEVEGD